MEEAKKRYTHTKTAESLIDKNIILFLMYKIWSRINKSIFVKENDATKICHGSAIIFSEKYFQKYDDVFWEKTFLYGEEAFLNFRKQRDNLKVIYSNDVRINHNESISTKKQAKNFVAKRKFIAHHRHLASKKILSLYECEECL